MMIKRFGLIAVLLTASLAANAMPLQPLSDKVTRLKMKGMSDKVWYVPSTVDTIKWGYLPNATDKPVITVPSGTVVVFDTLSHEGMLEDQGRDARKYFMLKGVSERLILKDAIAITRSSVPHDFAKDGPHIITGPVAIEGAQPGDVFVHGDTAIANAGNLAGLLAQARARS